MGGTLPPVIAIDGPSASGKGTIAEAVAQRLSFHYLDSGAIYRIVGLVGGERGVNLDNDLEISIISLNLNINFESGRVWVDGRDVSAQIRGEVAGAAASRVAALPGVRRALMALQRGFRQPPGLVADGRDMGSVVFPDASLKIYLTATPEERALRRHKQLMEKDSGASMAALLQDIRDRDLRDSTRAAAPLLKCADAIEIDTTGTSVKEVVEQVLHLYQKHQKTQ
ncbi:MAG: (d)CMP kinase [Burkholderiales bacterium]|nr:(d)CMP kinase [Burkholderiales bacterium]